MRSWQAHFQGLPDYLVTSHGDWVLEITGTELVFCEPNSNKKTSSHKT